MSTQSPLKQHYQSLKEKSELFESLQAREISLEDLLEALKIVADVSDRDFEDQVDWEQMLRENRLDEESLLNLQLSPKETSAFMVIKEALEEPNLFQENSIKDFIKERQEETSEKKETQPALAENREKVFKESKVERVKLASELWNKFLTLNWSAKALVVAGGLLVFFLGSKLAGKVLSKSSLKDKVAGLFALAGMGSAAIIGVPGIREKIYNYFDIPADITVKGLSGLKAAEKKLEDGLKLLEGKKKQVEEFIDKDKIEIDDLRRVGQKEVLAFLSARRDGSIDRLAKRLNLSPEAIKELKERDDPIDIIDCLIENDVIPIVKNGAIELVSLGTKAVCSAGLLLFNGYKKSLTRTAEAYADSKWKTGGVLRAWSVEGVKYAILFGSSNVALKFITGNPKYHVLRGILNGFGWPATIPAFVFKRAKDLVKFASVSLKTGKFALEVVAPMAKATKKVVEKAPRAARLAKNISKRLEKEVVKICVRVAETKLVKKIIKRVALKKGKKLAIKRGVSAVGGLLGSPIVSGGLLLWGVYDLGMLGKDLYEQYERVEAIKDESNPITKLELDDKSVQVLDQAISEGRDEIEAFRKLSEARFTIKREGLEGEEVWVFENGILKDVKLPE